MKNFPFYLFFLQIVINNKKWIHYNNMEPKKLWGKQNEPPLTIPKASLDEKVNLCIWQDLKSPLW